MSFDSKKYVDDIRSLRELISVIEYYYPNRLKNNKMVCVFHNDKNPSFFVKESSSGDGFYKCFGCGETGDIISFIRKVENDCYMYKVQDVELTASLGERIFGLGTVTCFTGDTTHPKLILLHIKQSKQIKNFILEASERARMRRRTLNTLNIGAGDIDDGDM